MITQKDGTKVDKWASWRKHCSEVIKNKTELIDYLIRENNQLREKLGMPLRGMPGYQLK